MQLAYVSVPSRPLTQSDLDAIAERSAHHNAANGLTGLLLYRGAFFYSLLEGSEPKVLRRMEVIITDNRHREIRILLEREIAIRRFANWSFGALPPPGSGLANLQSRDEFIRILSSRLT